MTTKEQLNKELAEQRKAQGRYTNVDEWGRYVSLDFFTEFNVIFPTLLEGHDVFTAVKGARFSEPAIKDGSYFDETRVGVSDAAETKFFNDAILTTTTGQTAHLRQDGTIDYETTRSTSLTVRIDGKLMLVHSHSSAHGDESPPYHARDQFWPKR